MKEKPTDDYLKENKYVFSLDSIKISGEKQFFYTDSVFKLIIYKIINLKNGLSVYIKELVSAGTRIKRLKYIKNSKQDKFALVIGNGPTQGYLSLDSLNELKKRGFDLYTVNYWNQNKELSSVIPDFLVLTDPDTFKAKEEDTIFYTKDQDLFTYLQAHHSIKIVCPLRKVKEYSGYFGESRVIGIVDAELMYWTKNIKPIFPRGYSSMTLYKALALAKWQGYKRIFVIGMDNTYPRNVYCDHENRLIRLELHAEADNYTLDMSDLFHNMDNYIASMIRLFRDAHLFKGDVVNLDPFSLTDAFEKIPEPFVDVDQLKEYLN